MSNLITTLSEAVAFSSRTSNLFLQLAEATSLASFKTIADEFLEHFHHVEASRKACTDERTKAFFCAEHTRLEFLIEELGEMESNLEGFDHVGVVPLKDGSLVTFSQAMELSDANDPCISEGGFGIVSGRRHRATGALSLFK